MNRAVAFSAKKKKQQIKDKRQRKIERYRQELAKEEQEKDERYFEHHPSLREEQNNEPEKKEIELPMTALNNEKSRRIADRSPRLFDTDSREEIARRIRDGMKPLDLSLRVNGPIPSQELDSELIPFPIRPGWSFDMAPEELDNNEKKYFNDWLSGVLNKYDLERLNYFECNIETWRQLWRVCERSDVLLNVVDSRYPLFHFNPGFYDYVTNQLKKPMLIVMTKSDLAYKEAIEAWKNYFESKFRVTVCVVSSFSGYSGSPDDFEITKLRKKHAKLRGHESKYASAEGVHDVIETIRKRFAETHPLHKDETDEERQQTTITGTKRQNSKRFITIGTVGNPNVGKSSFINALKGKHTVSVSRTPGHTKHFQTVFITNDIQLCDCPGMIFPALDRAKHLQILNGLYPLSQLREPYTALRYVAEHLPLEKIYNIESFKEDPETPWSPFTIAEAYALRHQMFLGKTAQPDTHQAARDMLVQIVDGRVRLCWSSPGSVIKINCTQNEEIENELVEEHGFVLSESSNDENEAGEKEQPI